MATLRKEAKLAARNRESEEEHPRPGTSRDKFFVELNDQYITEVSEKFEGRVTSRTFQEQFRVENKVDFPSWTSLIWTSKFQYNAELFAGHLGRWVVATKKIRRIALSTDCILKLLRQDNGKCDTSLLELNSAHEN